MLVVVEMLVDGSCLVFFPTPKAPKRKRLGINDFYVGMSFRMVLDLGLHLNSKRLVELGYLSEEEHNIRSITFWGCFIFDRYFSFLTSPPWFILTVFS